MRDTERILGVATIVLFLLSGVSAGLTLWFDRRRRLEEQEQHLSVRLVSGVFYAYATRSIEDLLTHKQTTPFRRPARFNPPDIPLPLYCSSTVEAVSKEAAQAMFGFPERAEAVRDVRVWTLLINQLPVLDLTDEVMRRRCGVSLADLISSDLAPSQEAAKIARSQPHVGGILAPSSVSSDAVTLVVFNEWIANHVDALSVAERLLDLRRGIAPLDVEAVRREIADFLSEAMSPSDAEVWLQTPNVGLGGKPPMEALYEGQVEAVRSLAAELIRLAGEGAYK